jgi:hypothetical protein
VTTRGGGPAMIGGGPLVSKVGWRRLEAGGVPSLSWVKP